MNKFQKVAKGIVMVSGTNTLQRGGFFLFLALITMPLLSMQKKREFLCPQCSHALETHLHPLNKSFQNAQDHTRAIERWAERQHRCKDCFALHPQQKREISPEEKLKLEKTARLRNKGMFFLAFLCAWGLNQYPELIVPLNVLCIIFGIVFAIEAFCYNPEQKKLEELHTPPTQGELE